jgi:neuronal guanine nucleotide exchange factor
LQTVVNYRRNLFSDDSDHHYESLYSIQQQRAALEGKLENEKPLGQDFDKFRENGEEYDSFDDSDEENEESKTNVDISNVKLPDPPQNTTGQVYAFVQRIKNFGSISKNEISKGISKIAKKRGSLGKIPSSRSQFYESTQIAEESPYVPPKYESKSLGKKSRGLAKLQKLGRLTINKLPTNFSLNEPFDHSQYQTPRIGTKESESNSSPNLSKSMSNFNLPESDVSKNDKSLKSKLRKASAPSMGSSSTSNIYGALSSKNSTFYVTDSHDVDSGIFAVNEKSTSSPDNSNLNLSSNSSSSVNCDLKRRSIASINGSTSSRPNDPPPPPPSETASRSRRIGTTSWYAECGLFKNEDINDEENHHHMMITDEKGEKTSAASWYTESGLYQTSNNSVAR